MGQSSDNPAASTGELFFDLSVDPMCVFARDGRFVRVNAAFRECLGYSEKELVGARFSEFLHPEDAARTEEVIARPPDGASVRGFRNRYRRRDGRFVHFEWHSTYHAAADVFAAIARDVTDSIEREDRLERTRRILHRTQELAKIGGWEFDAKSGQIFWTEQVVRLHERPPEAGTPTVAEAIALYHPDDQPLVRSMVERAFAHGTPWRIEVRIVTWKGNVKHVRCAGEPHVENGEVTKIYGAYQDIDDEIAARAALAASREQLRQVIDLVPLLIHAKDAQGRYLLVNRATAELLGRTVDEVVGAADADLVADARMQAQARERDAEVLRDGKPVHFKSTGRTTDEAPERTFDVVKIPFDPGAAGGPAVLTVAADITREHRMSRLNEALRRLSLRLSQSRTLHESGRIVADECCAFFAYDAFFVDYYDDLRNVVVGVHNEDIPPGGDRPVPMPTFEVPAADYKPKVRFDGKPTLINRAEPPKSSEFVMMGDKQRYSMSLMYAPVRWTNKVIGLVSVQSYSPGRYREEDLEALELFAEYCGGALSRHRAEQDRYVLEEQIHNARRLESLGILAGGVAHDFNNLLMGILGNAELAMLDVERGSPAQEPLKTIVRTTQRAADLCRQMLAYAGRSAPNLEFVSINAIAADVLRMIEVGIAKNVALRRSLAADLPAVRADATQLGQTIMNLVLNSADAVGAARGEILVRTGTMQCERALLKEGWIDDQLPAGPYVFVDVEDNGHGMDSETLKRIFDPFFTTKFAGRGLGLAAVLGIVRAHRGTIHVSSEPGKGTKFRIYLPASPDGAPRPPTPSSGEVSVGAVNGTVLFVDDDELIREAGSRFLELAGLSVIVAEDGLQAVALFQEHRETIDVVVMDLTMPRLDGEGAMARIRALDPDAIVLLSSGWSEKDTAERFAGREPAGFLHKPYKPGVLVERVRDLIASRRAKGR